MGGGAATHSEAKLRPEVCKILLSPGRVDVFDVAHAYVQITAVPRYGPSNVQLMLSYRRVQAWKGLRRAHSNSLLGLRL